MTKAMFTIITLSSLLCILGAQQTSSLRSYNALPLTNLAAVSDGKITLTATQSGAYVTDVDFAKNQAKSTKMSLALYNSFTVFTRKCLQFENYPCGQYDFCSEVKSDGPTFYYFPYFFAKANNITTQAFLDYNHWTLSNGAYSIYTISCESNASTPHGSGSYGLIGLGTDMGSNTNYLENVKSFTLTTGDKSNFNLEFNPNMDFKKNTIAKFNTDKNWNIPAFVRMTIKNQNFKLHDTKAIFDLNHPSIGFPLAIYKVIIDTLNSFGVYCSNTVLYQAECSYNGNFNDLPTIRLYVETQGDSIEITPSMYIVNGEDYKNKPMNRFNLNLRGTDPHEQGDSYVTAEYKNHIIIGSSVLRYFITHFDTAGPSINFYTRNEESPSLLKYVLIALGAALGIIIITVLVCYAVKNAKKNKEDRQYYPIQEAHEGANVVQPVGDGTSLQPQPAAQ